MTYDAIFAKNIDICKLFEENSVNAEENVLEDGIISEFLVFDDCNMDYLFGKNAVSPILE